MAVPAPARSAAGRLLRKFVMVSVAVASIAAATAGLSWLAADQHLPLREVVVTGDPQQVDAKELQALLRGYLGRNFLRLPLAEVRHKLESHPWVAMAVVRRQWPDRLVVTVEERVPVARWGDRELVDDRGIRFVADTGPFWDLPLVNGPSGQERDMLTAYQGIAASLARVGLQPEAVVLSERRSWRVGLRNGIELVLGRHDLDQRLLRFERVWPGLLAGRAAQIDAVDMRYANGFAVRWAVATEQDAG